MDAFIKEAYDGVHALSARLDALTAQLADLGIIPRQVAQLRLLVDILDGRTADLRDLPPPPLVVEPEPEVTPSPAPLPDIVPEPDIPEREPIRRHAMASTIRLGG